MSLFIKSRTGPGAAMPPGGPAQRTLHSASAMAVAKVSAMPAAPAAAPHASRLSNGLKEFLWQLDGIGHGHLLDLGPARQTTITFFIERGFKVYTDDFLTTLKIYLDAEEKRKQESAPDANSFEMTPAARAQKFLATTLQYPPATFDAVLMWDILDYLDNDLMTQLAARITSLVRDGGVVFAIFHARKPETFHRYRVLDAENLELIPTPCPFVPQRVFQNREISNLFSRYRSSKTFVGRDQIREGLFVK
jgi:hypothetical protein